MTLQAEVLEFGRTNAGLLRGAGDSPAAVALLERTNPALDALLAVTAAVFGASFAFSARAALFVAQ